MQIEKLQPISKDECPVGKFVEIKIHICIQTSTLSKRDADDSVAIVKAEIIAHIPTPSGRHNQDDADLVCYLGMSQS
jgi:hypothetical protein